MTHCALLSEPGKIPRIYKDAIERTEGMVMAFDGKPISAMLTAECGGRTVPAGGHWGVKTEWSCAIDDTFCSRYRWEFRCGRDRLKEIFGVEPNEWVIGYNSYGIIDKVYIDKEMSGFDFWNRMVDEFGWGVFRSPSFSMRILGDSALFDGVGFGHRIGLCQSGAAMMARKGFPFDEILKYYFPKTQLVRLKHGR